MLREKTDENSRTGIDDVTSINSIDWMSLCFIWTLFQPIYTSTLFSSIFLQTERKKKHTPSANIYIRVGPIRESWERNWKRKSQGRVEMKSAGADSRKHPSSHTEAAAAAGITQAERLMEGNLVIQPFWCHLFLSLDIVIPRNIDKCILPRWYRRSFEERTHLNRKKRRGVTKRVRRQSIYVLWNTRRKKKKKPASFQDFNGYKLKQWDKE